MRTLQTTAKQLPDEERVATLTSIVDEYKDFFGFTYTQTEFTDATFIGDGTHDTFELSFTLGGNGEPRTFR